MKKYKIFFMVMAAAFVVSTGCKKFLDINKDPNHPTSVKEGLILTPVEITTGTQMLGGYYGTTIAYWMQQMSLNQPSPGTETYLILPADVDNTWSFYLYPNTFENLHTMIGQAEAAGHHEYVAIGMTLFAYNMAFTTDLWGNVPFSQALKVPEVLNPKYDNQETIYIGIQQMLDSALYYVDQSSANAPGSDDVVYGGKMSMWKKFIYTLKARYYLRLTKAPGHTAALQADSALAALQNGFASNADNATIAYSGSAQAESPWYENTLPGAGGVVLSKYFVDGLISRNDPRLAIIADTNENGAYVGRAAGANVSPDPNVFSSLNTFYGGYLPIEDNSAGSAASVYLATYSEALFIKAEATFYKSGAAAAQPIYDSAISAHMQMLGIGGADRNTYITARPALTSGNALQEIIDEKYVADFLSVETYNDWRRTGFPNLAIAQNAYVQYIPRRWPYSSTELLTNPQPEQNGLTTASRVWWDAQ